MCSMTEAEARVELLERGYATHTEGGSLSLGGLLRGGWCADDVDGGLAAEARTRGHAVVAWWDADLDHMVHLDRPALPEEQVGSALRSLSGGHVFERLCVDPAGPDECYRCVRCRAALLVSSHPHGDGVRLGGVGAHSVCRPSEAAIASRPTPADVTATVERDDAWESAWLDIVRVAEQRGHGGSQHLQALLTSGAVRFKHGQAGRKAAQRLTHEARTNGVNAWSDGMVIEIGSRSRALFSGWFRLADVDRELRRLSRGDHRLDWLAVSDVEPRAAVGCNHCGARAIVARGEGRIHFTGEAIDSCPTLTGLPTSTLRTTITKDRTHDLRDQLRRSFFERTLGGSNQLWQLHRFGLVRTSTAAEAARLAAEARERTLQTRRPDELTVCLQSHERAGGPLQADQLRRALGGLALRSEGCQLEWLVTDDTEPHVVLMCRYCGFHVLADTTSHSIRFSGTLTSRCLRRHTSADDYPADTTPSTESWIARTARWVSSGRA